MLKLNCHRGDVRGGTWLVGGTGAVVKVQSSTCSVLPLRLFATGCFTQKALLDAPLSISNFPVLRTVS